MVISFIRSQDGIQFQGIILVLFHYIDSILVPIKQNRIRSFIFHFQNMVITKAERSPGRLAGNIRKASLVLIGTDVYPAIVDPGVSSQIQAAQFEFRSIQCPEIDSRGNI
ncbi:hypothetical protein ES708_20494 [subsurface metagenome]